jgi:hypothetical protein
MERVTACNYSMTNPRTLTTEFCWAIYFRKYMAKGTKTFQNSVLLCQQTMCSNKEKNEKSVKRKEN